MRETPSETWHGQERRKSPRLRHLLDDLLNRTTELHDQFVVLSSEVAQMRAELNDLRNDVAPNPVVGK